MKKTSKKAPAKKNVKVASKAVKPAVKAAPKATMKPAVVAVKAPVQETCKIDWYDLCCDIGMSIIWGLIGSILFGMLSVSYIILTDATPSSFLQFDLIVTALGISGIVFYFKEKQGK